MTRGLEIDDSGGFIPPAELRELGERLGREILVTASFMICRKQSVLTRNLRTDYAA
jgi:hypothetical protein